MKNNFLLLCGSLMMAFASYGWARHPITLGTQNTVEDLLWGEIISRVIKTSEKGEVVRREGMETSANLSEALLKGDIDLALDSTGTLTPFIVNNSAFKSPEEIRNDGGRRGYLRCPLMKSDFPALLAKNAFATDHPPSWRALGKLRDQMSVPLMAHLETLVQKEKKSYAEAADIFMGSTYWNRLAEKRTRKIHPPPPTGLRFFRNPHTRYLKQVGHLTIEHLWLLFIAIVPSVLIGIPLGMLTHRLKGWGEPLLITVETLLAIPPIALLFFFVPVFGVGMKSVALALLLFGLLPIVQKTHAGLDAADSSAINDGKSPSRPLPLKTLRLVQRPVALRQIIRGIKTSAVLSVGTATLAAFIGAGGYGTLIATGLSLNDIQMILKGAFPAALLAIVVHYLFEGLEEWLLPRS